MEMIALYKNKDGVYIIQISQGVVYYGNGKDINGFGFSALQFLRFNPYMEMTEENEQVPEDIKKYIIANKPDETTGSMNTIELYKRKKHNC